MNRIVRCFLALSLLVAVVLPASAQRRRAAAPAAAPAPAPTPTPGSQWIACLGDDGTTVTLPVIPEIAAKDGKLRGNLLLSDAQERIAFRVPFGLGVIPGGSGTSIKCAPNYVRTFQAVDDKGKPVPGYPPQTGTYPDPMPGPTLRARVGDLVQLTFVNQINTQDFGDSIDRGEKNTGTGCDETGNNIYPGTTGDTYPDCFHGSSTGNIHFHGTHTNPNSTGDNVFLEIRPSLRTNGKPVVTPASVKPAFDRFFAECAQKLQVSVLSEWPYAWSDLPLAYRTAQEAMLKKYDTTPNIKKLWPVDAAQIKKGDWPQYYIGAYPYCYRIPDYVQSTFPPPAPAAGHHTGGPLSGAPPRALQMGQSPGTHWYHAHKHGSTAINVANGMTGAIIIEGGYDDALNAVYGTNFTRNAKVLVINQLGVSPNLERGIQGVNDKGANFSVNGRINPVFNMYPGEVQMWRIVNTSGRASALFAAPGGAPAGLSWKQIAQDGVQFNSVNFNSQHFANNSFLLAAGNRADLLVQAPANPGPIAVTAQNEVDPTDLLAYPTPVNLPLFTVNVTGSGPAMTLTTTAPAFPPFLIDIKPSEVTGTKVVTFASTPPNATPTTNANPAAQHTINGTKFNGEVGEVVLMNNVEEWKIVNQSYGPLISHPFHIHINPFQITEIFSPNDTLRTDNGSGTVAIANNSAVVTGSGTTFTNLSPGYGLNIPGQGALTVLSVTDDFHLTLTAPLTVPPPGSGTTASGLTYTINVPRYVFVNSPAPLAGQCYLNPAADQSTWKPCAAVSQPPAQNNIWWDTFPIPSGITVTWSGNANGINIPGYFKLRSRFVDYAGYYVIHCHILAHEDRGMMTVVEVAPLTSPYSHD
jgi:FtsP/CotA-like multicopper oxidase with cupredoxin domain